VGRLSCSTLGLVEAPRTGERKEEKPRIVSAPGLLFVLVYIFVYKTIDVLCIEAIPNHKKNTTQRALDGVGQR
jgi:hypothetical protein